MGQMYVQYLDHGLAKGLVSYTNAFQRIENPIWTNPAFLLEE